MKIGFKGTDYDLKCRNEQYEIGKVYAKTLPTYKKAPQLCTTDGYHYCTTLEAVYKHYGNTGVNRFFLIEVLGPYTETEDKCITTSFRILQEISVNGFGVPLNLDIQSLLSEIKRKEEEEKRYEEEVNVRIKKRDDEAKAKKEKEEARHARNFNFKLIRELQEKYPTMSLGGSAALFLHGVRLDRWMSRSNHSDIDICLPYYQYLETWDKDITVQELNIKRSGNDFDYGFSIEDYRVDLTPQVAPVNYLEIKETKSTNFLKIDIKVDPKQRYTFIEYQGFKYKVNRLEVILEAKARYAMAGDNKHIEDLREMTYGSRELPTKI